METKVPRSMPIDRPAPSLQVVVDTGASIDSTVADLESSLTDLIGTAYLARALDAGEPGVLDQWLFFRRLVRRMQHARSPAGRPHDTPTPAAIERAMRRQRTIMRNNATRGLVIAHRSTGGRLGFTATYGSDSGAIGLAALNGARTVIEMIIARQAAAVDPAKLHEIDRAEAEQITDVLGPTHPRASSEQFAALDDGRAVAAVETLAAHRAVRVEFRDQP